MRGTADAPPASRREGGRGRDPAGEARLEAEREFIASVFSAEDVGAFIARRFPGLSFRAFRDGRHRVLWRALEVLPLGDAGAAREQRLGEELEKAGALGRAGGRKYLRDVLSRSDTPLMARVAAHTLGFPDPGDYYG
ncbi:MAG: hypothetical protein LBQ14_07860 [Treponema sp.]|jgi:hypothetical protein|nr:hypothetical protein [Treponema sp.]